MTLPRRPGSHRIVRSAMKRSLPVVADLPSLAPTESPTVPSGARRILDLGCGDGREISRVVPTRDSGASRLVCGVDIDMTSLRALKARSATVQCVRAYGEQLPFRDATFDYVMSGVALPYMDIPRTLREVGRVLRDGGELWASLRSVPTVLDHLRRSIGTLNWKDILYRTYVLVNGFSLHFTDRLFRFPLNRRRIESGQTRRGVTRALQSAGFSDVLTNRGRCRFVVTARMAQTQAR